MFDKFIHLMVFSCTLANVVKLGHASSIQSSPRPYHFIRTGTEYVLTLFRQFFNEGFVNIINKITKITVWEKGKKNQLKLYLQRNYLFINSVSDLAFTGFCIRRLYREWFSKILKVCCCCKIIETFPDKVWNLVICLYIYFFILDIKIWLLTNYIIDSLYLMCYLF